MWLSGVGLNRIYNMLLKWCRKKMVKGKIKGNKTDLLYERDLNDTLYEMSKFHDLQMASRGFTLTSDWTWWMTCEGKGLPSYQAGISECLCFKGCVRMRAFSWEVFFKRYTLHSWLDFNVKCRYAAEQWSNSAVSNEKCPLSLEQEQTWPHRAALAHQISILFFSRQITRFTNSFILHIMHFESGRLSLHTTIFDFIVRKGVPLIMVMAQQ